MSIVAEGEKELPDEDKGVEDVDLKVEGVVKDGNDAGKRTLQAQCSIQVQQQQSQSGAICWERFLHVTSIKVLLVESDDSTRHVVTALLRNCNYEVIEAANGLQAWRFLEDLTNHIDLVLTELEMPCVSGIGLLCKIMSHKTRKNVPVIMMSSRDSMSLVFKCLSKGAVDFLVKPIRKNELKNLWQHVWRRCHSSSGSGSESGTQTQNSEKSKSVERCDNGSDSNDGDDNASDGLNIGDGSDDGSGTQSSWTKQAVEVDSSQAVSPIDQVSECPDSTCAQVIRPNAENSGNRRVHVAAAEDFQEEKQPDNNAKMSEKQHENPIDVPGKLMGEKLKNVVEIEEEQIFRKGFEAEKAVAVTENNTIHESKKEAIESSLKRQREAEEPRETSQDNRCVFRCSEQSAFTRYNTSSKSNPSRTPNGLTGNSLVINSGLESANNVVSNNIDMGSTTNKLALNKHYPLNSHHFHSQEQQPGNKFLLKQLSTNALNSDSSNVLVGTFEGNLGNHSLNKSATGSNNGKTETLLAGNGGSGDASGSGSGNRIDPDKLAQREAALIKFRQKKKKRCFKKKVRYQNRKRLAEQRPRVRGQFVRQAEQNKPSTTKD